MLLQVFSLLLLRWEIFLSPSSKHGGLSVHPKEQKLIPFLLFGSLHADIKRVTCSFISCSKIQGRISFPIVSPTFPVIFTEGLSKLIPVIFWANNTEKQRKSVMVLGAPHHVFVALTDESSQRFHNDSLCLALYRLHYIVYPKKKYIELLSSLCYVWCLPDSVWASEWELGVWLQLITVEQVPFPLFSSSPSPLQTMFVLFCSFFVWFLWPL